MAPLPASLLAAALLVSGVGGFHAIDITGRWPSRDPARGGGRALAQAAPDAPAGGGAACTLTVGGVAETFDACVNVTGYAPEMRLFFTLRGDGSLRLGLSARTDGWAAVGFPERPGFMVGATALVLRAAANGSGATFGDYFLAARAVEGVRPPGRLPVSGAAAAAAAGGALAGAATLRLTDEMLGAASALPVLYAAGPLAADGALRQHTANAGATLDLTTGTTNTSSSAGYKRDTDAHGWLMAVGWTLVLAGVAVARSFKDAAPPPLWFNLHRGANTLGLAAATAALVLIFVAREGKPPTAYGTHRRLGLAAMSLGYWQALAWVARPRPGPSALRRAWEWVHYFVGRAALGCALGNVYYALLHVYPSLWGELGTAQPWAVAAFTAVAGGLVAAALAKDVRDVAAGRRSLASLVVPVAKGPPPPPPPPADAPAKEGL